MPIRPPSKIPTLNNPQRNNITPLKSRKRFSRGNHEVSSLFREILQAIVKNQQHAQSLNGSLFMKEAEERDENTSRNKQR